MAKLSGSYNSLYWNLWSCSYFLLLLQGILLLLPWHNFFFLSSKNAYICVRSQNNLIICFAPIKPIFFYLLKSYLA